MKKVFTLTVVFLCCATFSFAQVSDYWLQAGRVTHRTIAVSKDGKKLYAVKASATELDVIDASNGNVTGALKWGAVAGFPTFTQGIYGGAVAVDRNGAIYACDVQVPGTRGPLNVIKWDSESTSPAVLFASAPAVSNPPVIRAGYGMDVYVDENGDGFLIVPRGGHGDAANPANESDEIYYWEIKNNVAQSPVSVSVANYAVAGYTQVKIIDNKSFWMAGRSQNGARPMRYCEITKRVGDTEYGNPVTIDSKAASTTDIPAVAQQGMTEFMLAGKRYFVYSGGANIARLKEVTSTSLSGITFAGSTYNLPSTGNLGGAANTLYIVNPAVHVEDNVAYIYVSATVVGMGAFKAEAVETPILDPPPGKYENEEGALDVALLATSAESAPTRSTTAGVEVRYTTDGTTPTASSPLLSGTIPLSTGTTVIKMLATNAGFFDNLSEATYEVQKAVGIPKVKTLKIYTQGGNIFVPAAAGKTIEVFSVLGQKVKSVVASGNTTVISGLAQGQIYIVKVDGQTAKVKL